MKEMLIHCIKFITVKRHVIMLMIFTLLFPTLTGCSLSDTSGTTTAAITNPTLKTSEDTSALPSFQPTAESVELIFPTSDSQLFVYMELEEDQDYLIDLNNDRRKDTLKCHTGKNSSGERETTVSVNGSSIISEVFHWAGGIYLVDLDTNDGYLDLAIQNLGELTWAQTAFIYYDGDRLINRGVVQSTNENGGDILPPDRLGDIRLDGMGGLVSRTRSGFLMTWFYEENWHMDTEGILKIVPKSFYPFSSQDEPIELVLMMDLPLYADPEAPKTTMTAKTGETVTLLGTDKIEWAQVRTREGVTGWFRVINLFKIEVGSTIFDERDVFEGLCFAE